MFKLVHIALLALGSALLFSCSKTNSKLGEPPSLPEIPGAKDERSNSGGEILSTEGQARLEKILSEGVEMEGYARVAILYFQDQPAHRVRTLEWLEENGAELLYENETFGYVDARVPWDSVGEVVAKRGDLGLDQASLMKLELAELKPKGTSGPTPTARHSPPRLETDPIPNSSLNGPVHSAGFGAQVEAFREKVAQDLGGEPSDYEGQGSTIAVYDGGIDLRRTDVFGDRLVDFIVAAEENWVKPKSTLSDFLTTEGSEIPEELESLTSNSTAAVVEISESDYKDYDLNGSGKIDSIHFLVYKEEDTLFTQYRPYPGLPWGPRTRDYKGAREAGENPIINLFTGEPYTLTRERKAGAGISRLREKNGQIQLAFVGFPVLGDHGIANLHMAAGDYRGEGVRYHGTAPSAKIIGVHPWKQTDYAESWIAVTRGMILATEAGADVLDLDIFTEGTLNGGDLVDSLACRIIRSSKTVPIAASHNFGAIAGSVQSWSQSPCILGIGASISVGAARHGYADTSVNPKYKDDREVMTAYYSGRGPGYNGLYKPDIISPAYGLTAYRFGKFGRFGGTSGATPATSGMIALLKQAGRILGLELGFAEIRYLLQAGSQVPNRFHDGYGYTDLLESWEALRRLADSDGFSDSFFLRGHQFVNIDRLPREPKKIEVKLERPRIVDDVTTSTPMKFWFEYETPETQGWLRLLNPATDELVSEFVTDAPIYDMPLLLQIYTNLTEDQWTQLENGDHWALLKGVRLSHESPNGRASDFSMPIVFTKGDSSNELIVETDDLYLNEYKNLVLATEPGERVFLSGNSSCAQGRLDEGWSATQTGINLRIDNRAHISHTIQKFRRFPLPSEETAFAIQAGSKTTRITVENDMGCAGASWAHLEIRRFRIDANLKNLVRLENAGQWQVSGHLELEPEGFSPESSLVPSGNVLRWEPKESVRTLSRLIPSQWTSNLPSNAKQIRLRMPSDRIFRGSIVFFDSLGLPIQTTTTEDRFSAGFESDWFFSEGKDFVLGAEVPDDAVAVGIEGHSTGNIAIEIDLETDLTLPSREFHSWWGDETKTLGLEFNYSAAIPEELVSSNGLWTQNLRVSYKIVQDLPEIWEGWEVSENDAVQTDPRVIKKGMLVF